MILQMKASTLAVLMAADTQSYPSLNALKNAVFLKQNNLNTSPPLSNDRRYHNLYLKK